ncbi:MAG: hypothetical protein ACT4NY_25690 [Pseudonocardiales bacterium]
MRVWPRWARGAAAGALPQYVHRGAVAPLLPEKLAAQLPGPSDEPPMQRARQIYEVLAQRGISYVHEPTSSEAGRQAIRPPDQVLTGPRQATCLDLAVTFCGACLDAGLHPLVVTLDSGRGEPGHALVLVWLKGSWAGAPAGNYPWRTVVHEQPPAELTGQLRAAADQPGSFLAVDVTGATRASGAETTPWATAICRGAELVTSALAGNGAWRWGTAVDIGVGWRAADVHPLPRHPLHNPLVAPYLEPKSDHGPLKQIEARRTVVPFYARDELDVLLDWCQAPDVAQAPGSAQRSRIALVHGVGGAGKTHLAAELARKLGDEGWYAGFLSKPTDSDGLQWLAGVVSPLLVVVDYPEDVRAGTVISLLKALRSREEPTCVILTARVLGGWWKEITDALDREAVPYTAFPLELPRRHPSTTGVFQRAWRAFVQRLGLALVDAATPPPNQRWTTLDLIMLAWLAAQGATALPTSPEKLYDEILDREFRYWTRVCRQRGLADPPDGLLPAVGACVTLLGPTPDRVEPTLRAVAALQQADEWRHQIATVIKLSLPADSDTGTVALRPDPVGERLVLHTSEIDSTFLRNCLTLANDNERMNACLTITRAAERDEPGATALATTVLADRPELWQPALAVVAAQGGPFGAPLLALADRDDSPLPLAQLAETIPLGHVTLRNLALIATQRTRPPDPAAPDNPDAHARLAGWWNNLSNRQSETGDRTGALNSITEAVTIRRQLAQTNPAAFLPDLAMSLNNLSNCQSQTGDRTGALNSITEAVTIRRQLAQTNPAAFLPNLATSLNNLSNRQSQTGDRTGALNSITEATNHYRQLAQTNPAAFLPDLATSLNNLSNQHAETGEPQRALDAYATAWADLPPGPQAELAVTRSGWRADRGDPAGAAEDLHMAAKWAQQETDPPWAGRSRRAVRGALAALLTTDGTATSPHPDLPDWAWRPLPDDLIETLNQWLGAAGWTEREALLRTHNDLHCDVGRETVQLAGALYPEVEPIAQLSDILDDIAARGLDQVLAEFRAAHEHADLLRRWLATATWSESRDIVQAHPGLISDPRTVTALQAGAEDLMLAQHLGIVGLATRMPIAEVYDAVTDLEMAVDTAMSCVERGDAAMLRDLFLAAPGLGRLPFVTAFLIAVHTVLISSGEPDDDATPKAADIAALMCAAVEEGSDTQRSAGAARLRRLANRQPSHADALHELAGILTTADQATPAPDTATNPPATSG